MTLPYSNLRLNKFFAQEATFPELKTDEVTAKSVTVDVQDNTVPSTLTVQNVGGSGASSKIDLKPWSGRGAGAPISISATDRDFSADLVVRTAPFGNDGNTASRKRFIANDNGLSVCTDQLPTVALDVYGEARVRGNAQVDTIQYTTIPVKIKHFFTHHQGSYTDVNNLDTYRFFNLSRFFRDNGIPDSTQCLLHCSVIQYNKRNNDYRYGSLNTLTGGINDHAYAMPWYVERSGEGQDWYLKWYHPYMENLDARIYLVCSTEQISYDFQSS